MINSLIIILAQLVILSVLGLAALSALPARGRELLLPVVPVFGAALLAVVMSTTSRLWSALWGLLATVLVAAAIVALAVYRGQRPWVFSRSSVRTAALVWLVCTPGFFVALIPSAIVGDSMAVMPSGSHDTYYYIAESAWLHDNPLAPGPDVSGSPGDGNATPAYGPMRASEIHSLRLGQPMIHAALDTAMGTDAVQTVTPLIALWMFLIGPAAFVAARLLGARSGTALAAAVLTTSSAVVLQQVYQQNMDSLLGASLALICIATVLAALRGSPRDELWVGFWPAILALAALIAVYFEYALYVAPAILGAVFLRLPRGLPTRLRRSVVIGLLGIAIAPGAWWLAVNSFLLGTHNGGWPTSPYIDDGFLYALSRGLGITPLGGLARSPWLLAAIAVVVVVLGLALFHGIEASTLLSPHRGAWIGLLLVALPHLAYLFHTRGGYGLTRAVAVLMPVVILVAVLGWGELYPRIRERLGRTWQRPDRIDRVLIAAAAVFIVAAATVNLNAIVVGVNAPQARKQHYDAAAYAEALGWVEAHGGKDGRDVSVITPDYTPQLWIVYTLRHLPLVSYPMLRHDYLLRHEYWDGLADPYYLVGTGGVYAGGEVLDKNERYTFVSFADRPGVVAAPHDLAWCWPDANPTGSMSCPDMEEVRIVGRHLAPGQQVVLTIRTDRGDNATVSALIDNREIATSKVTDAIAKLTFTIDGDTPPPIHIDLSSDGVRTDGSFDVVGIDLVSGDPSPVVVQGR